MNQKIYLDNNATTTLDLEVLKVITDLTLPLNPSSVHFYGREAKKLLLESRNKFASFLKVKPENLIFTSGGTEAVNIGLRGIITPNSDVHIIASKIDHVCVYDTLKYFEKKGCEITYVNVGKYGAIKPEQIQENIKENTKLIVVSAVNSETGVKTNLDEIAKIAKEKDILLFVDGVAILGKELFTIPQGISTMAFSSHKIHGPKGVGLCFVNSKLAAFNPLFFGGPQEYEKRAGTENLSGILGFSKAVELLNSYLPDVTEKMLNLRNHFENTLLNNLKDIFINGLGPRTCNTSNICFKNVDAESLLILLDQNNIMASHGSACSSGSMSISRVLLNMGTDPKDARSSIRFSLSRLTTKEELDQATKIIISLVKKLRK
jgi:cysteine desulfurase